MCLAEGVGFEPTIRFPVYTLSKRAPEATRPSLRRAATVQSARTIVAGGEVATRSRRVHTAASRLVHQPHRAGLADVVSAKLIGPLAKAGRAHEAEQRLRARQEIVT